MFEKFELMRQFDNGPLFVLYHSLACVRTEGDQNPKCLLFN